MTNDHLMIHFWCIMCVCVGKSNSNLEVIYLRDPVVRLRAKRRIFKRKRLSWRNPTPSFLDPVLSHPGKNSRRRRLDFGVGEVSPGGAWNTRFVGERLGETLES